MQSLISISWKSFVRIAITDLGNWFRLFDMFEKLVLILGIPGQWTVPVVIEHLKVICFVRFFVCHGQRYSLYVFEKLKQDNSKL